MKILIQDLENKFLPTMLTNGLSYWKKDLFEVVDNSSTALKANAFGTDEYQTEIKFSGNFVTDVNCTCPYNKSMFCKHVAILYYEKLKEELGLKKAVLRKSKVVSTISKTNIDVEIFSKIKALSESQLRDLIVYKSEIDFDFRRFIIDYLSNDKSKKSLYESTKSRIKEILRTHKRQGYIDYQNANKVGKLVNEIASQAKKLFEDENYIEVFQVCKAIIETMIKPILETDTSSGLFTEGLDDCIDLLALISDKKITVSDKVIIFDFFIKEAKNKVNHGFGFEIKFIEIALLYASSKQEEILLSAISELNITKYNDEEYCWITFESIKKFKGIESADEYLASKLNFPKFRKIMYQKYIENKQFEEAKNLMTEGIKINSNLRGIVYEWKKNILEIAKFTNSKSDIKKISRLLFLEYGFSNFKNEDFFEILKSQFSKEEWKIESAELESNIKGKSDKEEFYYRENNYEALIKSISTIEYYYNNSIDIDSKYLDVLLPEYEAEIKSIFLNKIDNYLKNNTGTSTHKYVCEMLVRLKKRGITIDDMKNYFLEKYFNRPSFKTVMQSFFE